MRVCLCIHNAFIMVIIITSIKTIGAGGQGARGHAMGYCCFALALIRIVDSHNALYAIFFFVALLRKSATLLGVRFKLFLLLQFD